MKSKEQSDREKDREKQIRRNNVFSVGDRVEYHETEDEKVRAETRRVLQGICSTCPVHTLLDLDKDGAP